MRDTNWEFKLFIKLPLRKQLQPQTLLTARTFVLAVGNITKPFQTNFSTKLSSTKTKMGNFAKNFWSQQHPVFPGGHPSKYWLMLLNFSDRTRTGVFNMIWPLARAQENVNRLLFQQHKYILTYMRYLERFQQIRLRFAIWAFIQA